MQKSIGQEVSPESEVGDIKVEIVRPWWLHPVVPVSLIFPVALWTAASTSPRDYALWGTRKYLTQEMAWTAALLFAVFIVGLFLGASRLVRRDDSAYEEQSPVGLDAKMLARMDRLAYVLFLIVLSAYVLWAGSAVMSGVTLGHLMEVVRLQPGAISELKELARPIGGLTTFAQFSPVVIAVWTFLFRIGYRRRTYEMAVILVITLGRSFLYAERLATIEVLLPMVVIIAITPKLGRWNSVVQHSVRVIPLIALPVLWILFAIFEYTRSWTYYRTVTDFTYPEFVTQRLLGYYATSINNSGLYHHLMDTVPHSSYFTFPALQDFPLISWALGPPTFRGIEMNEWWMQTLTAYANPEFNNRGTLLVVDADLGTFGALLFWFVLGYILGWLFLMVRKGNFAAIVAYSCVFVGLLELPRYLYWTEGRFVAVALGIVVLSLSVARVRQWHSPHVHNFEWARSRSSVTGTDAGD